MELQTLLNTLLGVALAVIGWWLNTVWQTLKGLQEQVSAVHVKLVEHYAPRAELQHTFERIFEKLDQIQRGMQR